MSRIAVIVPVYNGGVVLAACLAAVAASRRIPDRVILVDDGSTDGAIGKLDPAGLSLLTLKDGPAGPARARNLGARHAADVDILVFIDADVAVHPDAIGRMVRHLEHDPDLAAVFGSYDDQPPVRDTVSLYKNLLHHHTHQSGNTDASTFWAGCGAIRRPIFEQLGGFDESYTRPSIEDIELGARIRAAGHRIRLSPDVLCTHHKRWTFGNLVRTDIFARALPWSRLLAGQEGVLNDLNLTSKQRMAALGAVGLGLSVTLVGWAPRTGAVSALLFALMFLAPNLGLFRLFGRVGGVRLLVGGAGLHWLYYQYSVAAFVWVKCTTALRRRAA